MILHAVNAAYHPPETADSCTAHRAGRQIPNAACSLTIETTLSCVCVCLQILHTGEIGEQAPIPAVTESVLRSSELREGTTVSLDQQVTCSVAFAKGQERRVFFAIQGLPQVCICPQISSFCHIFVLHLIADGHLPTEFPLFFHLHSVLHCRCAQIFSVSHPCLALYSLQLIARIKSMEGVQARRWYLTLVEGMRSIKEGVN